VTEQTPEKGSPPEPTTNAFILEGLAAAVEKEFSLPDPKKKPVKPFKSNLKARKHKSIDPKTQDTPGDIPPAGSGEEQNDSL